MSVIRHESCGRAILSTRHTGRVDFRRERMPAPTSLEGIDRDDQPRQSWTYDFSAKSRPVQLGVRPGCAELSTRVFADHKDYRTRLSSWYGPPFTKLPSLGTPRRMRKAGLCRACSIPSRGGRRANLGQSDQFLARSRVRRAVLTRSVQPRPALAFGMFAPCTVRARLGIWSDSAWLAWLLERATTFRQVFRGISSTR